MVFIHAFRFIPRFSASRKFPYRAIGANLSSKPLIYQKSQGKRMRADLVGRIQEFRRDDLLQIDGPI
jgi:hypothetical protein